MSVFFDRGDRWEAILRRPTRERCPSRHHRDATSRAGRRRSEHDRHGSRRDLDRSTIDANATGGVIRFADLVPLADADYTGEAMDLSGTIEFICDDLPAELLDGSMPGSAWSRYWHPSDPPLEVAR